MNLNFNNTNTQETKGFVSSFLNYGGNLCKINYIETVKSKDESKVQLKFWVEGKEIPGFEGQELPDGSKAKGHVGKVKMGIYFDPKDDSKLGALMNNLMYIAEKAEVADKVKTIEASTLEELLTKYQKVIANKFVWFVFKAEEYEANGKRGFSYSFKEGKVGQDTNGKDVYQVFCKHEKFKTSEEKDGDIVIKVKGTNQVGSNIGATDTLEFNPKYDLKLLAVIPADTEPTTQATIEDF